RDPRPLRRHAEPCLERCAGARGEAPRPRAEGHSSDRAGAAMRRLALSALVLLGLALAAPAAALAHDQPETQQSRWVMADWMLDTFFIFAGLALIAFLAAWKAGHFHELDKMGSIPL